MSRKRKVMATGLGFLTVALTLFIFCAFFIVCVDLQHLFATAIGYTPPSAISTKTFSSAGINSSQSSER